MLLSCYYENPYSVLTVEFDISLIAYYTLSMLKKTSDIEIDTNLSERNFCVLCKEFKPISEFTQFKTICTTCSEDSNIKGMIRDDRESETTAS